ncbi:thiolase family protein [Novosphingobium sp. G106]|uniref:thiolase family protein n=1 Tax=Novosphingobium sp. G106 TaxID=2849500 RepID=UPI001C2CD385|nr:thiolase family protein [Novosphingobium sp. G106]MBV1687863.1 thiolase family protein [Novosphingobium sp. G106]
MSVPSYPEKQVCITGVGQSKVGRPSDKSALILTIEACEQAIADAGLTAADIDGFTTYPGPVQGAGGFSPVGATETMFAMGLAPTWIGASTEGHAHMGAIISAIQAIASGLCRHVLVFRTVNQATARLAAHDSALLGKGSLRVEGGQSWNVPFNAISPAHLWALYAQAYFQKYGARAEQLGAIAVNSRAMAAGNPNAIYRKPLTIDEYMASRVITTPLRLFDCDTHIDGSTAIVFSRRDVAGDLRQPPIHIEAMGMSIGALGLGHISGDFTELPARRAGDMLWSRTDLKPKDVDVAQIYDGFSILTLLWLEALGLCKPGEAASFVEGGSRIGLGGELPLNTSGGQLSAGRFHGYGHTHEACIQLWGRGGDRQVAGARTCAVSNGGFGYGALLLRRD